MSEKGIAAGALFGNYLLQWSGVRGETDSTACATSRPRISKGSR